MIFCRPNAIRCQSNRWQTNWLDHGIVRLVLANPTAEVCALAINFFDQSAPCYRRAVADAWWWVHRRLGGGRLLAGTMRQCPNDAAVDPPQLRGLALQT